MPAGVTVANPVPDGNARRSTLGRTPDRSSEGQQF